MSIADKISKIIAKAESTTHPEEAEAFMAKAQSMLRDHGLSLLDLGKLDSDDPLGDTDNAGHYFAAEGWLRSLSGCLARYYGCQSVHTQVGRNKTSVHVFGRESARVTFTMMYPYVVREVRRQARAAVKAGEASTEAKAKRAIGNALSLRLARMTEQTEERTETKTQNALVPVDLIKQMMVEAYPQMREGRASKIRTDAAARKRANGINLHLQTAGAGQKRIAG